MVFLETQRLDFVFDVYKKDSLESFLYITFTQNMKTKTNISKGKGKVGTEGTMERCHTLCEMIIKNKIFFR